MALEKEITNANGTKETYHRIESIINDNGILIISIVSYVDKAHREKEKAIIAKQKRQLELGETIAKMCEVPPEERSPEYEAEIQALIKEEEELGNNIWNGGELMSSYHSYQIDIRDREDISFGDIYEELMKLDEFDGASISDVENQFKIEERITDLEKKSEELPPLTSPFTTNLEPTGVATRYYEKDELIAIYNNSLPITVIATIPISYKQPIIIDLNCELYLGGN